MAKRIEVTDVALIGGDSADARSGAVCSIAVIERPRGWDMNSLMEFVDSRLASAPRYRQKVRAVPLVLGRAVWVDDRDFDLSFHVRRSALPDPGGLRQLADLVARIIDRPLESTRPLWELYLIEGLADGRIAVLSKTHQALVDGRDYLDLTQVVLSEMPANKNELDVPTWSPSSVPSDGVLVVDALTSLVADPVDPLRRMAGFVARAEKAASSLVGAVTAPLRPGHGGVAESFHIRRATGSRVGFASFPLASVRGIARRHKCTVNDVVLCVLAGALRSWIQSWGRPLATSDVLNVMVPLAVHIGSSESEGPDLGEELLDPTGVGDTEIASAVIPLPVGEANPRVRLAQVARETAAFASAANPVGAQALAGFGGFAPATLHALGARAARLVPEGSFDLIVTNAPGPQHRMYWAEGELLEMYPVPALLPGQGLSVGLTSYDGMVYAGFTSDRSVVPDVDEIGELVAMSIAELEYAEPAGGRRGESRGPSRAPSGG